MTTLAVTYLVVWSAVVLYVARLAARQNRLRRQIEAITTQPTLESKRDSFSQAA